MHVSCTIVLIFFPAEAKYFPIFCPVLRMFFSERIEQINECVSCLQNTYSPIFVLSFDLYLCYQ